MPKISIGRENVLLKKLIQNSIFLKNHVEAL